MNYISSYILSILLIIAIVAGCYLFVEAVKIGMIIFSILFVLVVLPEIFEINKELKKQAEARKFYDDEDNQ